MKFNEIYNKYMKKKLLFELIIVVLSLAFLSIVIKVESNQNVLKNVYIQQNIKGNFSTNVSLLLENKQEKNFAYDCYNYPYYNLTTIKCYVSNGLFDENNTMNYNNDIMEEWICYLEYKTCYLINIWRKI